MTRKGRLIQRRTFVPFWMQIEYRLGMRNAANRKLSYCRLQHMFVMKDDGKMVAQRLRRNRIFASAAQSQGGPGTSGFLCPVFVSFCFSWDFGYAFLTDLEPSTESKLTPNFVATICPCLLNAEITCLHRHPQLLRFQTYRK